MYYVVTALTTVRREDVTDENNEGEYSNNATSLPIKN